MLNAVLIFCGVTLLLLAAVVLYSNYYSAQNRWLATFMISGFLWLLANLLANNAANSRELLLYSRATLVGASLLPFTYVMFCFSFAEKKVSQKKLIYLALPILGLLATVPTTLNIKSVSSDNAYDPGVSYAILLVIIVTYFGYGIRLLYAEYKKTAGTNRHQQLYYILLGTLLTILPAATLSVVMPYLGYAQAVVFAPATVLFFASFTTAAIIRHKLFDVRLVIARSLAYTTLILILASLYGFLILGAAKYFFGLQINLAAQVVLSITTALTGFAFQRFKRYFDKVTNRLFYQDAYDPQELFDNLNRLLVSTLDLDKLLNGSADLIENTFKTEYCLIGLRETMYSHQRVGGRIANTYDYSDLGDLRHLTVNYHQPIISVNELGPEDGKLRKLLQANNIEIIVRLASNLKSDEEGIGYIVLGHKKSGNPFGSKDYRVLETIANEMIIAFQNALHFEEIQNFANTLQQRVDEATKKLRKANEKLKALDETKDDFISMASHQLRTPLTSVKGYLSMVLEGDAGPITDQAREMLGQASFSAQRMVFLIADLLNVSRLKTGKFVVEPNRFNLITMVEQELSQLKETAASRQLTLEFEHPDSMPEVILDETKTRQVIMNFSDNAIYYTPAGGHIVVRLSETDTSVELRVIDDGIGVSKADQPHLFTKFYRAGNARKARPDGTGLGLFMAKKVIVAEGGSLIFDSEEGKGSTFGFSFAKSKVLAEHVTTTPVTSSRTTSMARNVS